MKKLILLLFVIGCVFTSCEFQDELDDVNVEEVSTEEQDDEEGDDPSVGGK